MSAMTAKDARCLGCLLIERSALEAKVARLNERIDEVDAYLNQTGPINIVLACGHRKELRDRRTGILCQLRAVRIEIEKLQGAADMSACRQVGNAEEAA